MHLTSLASIIVAAFALLADAATVQYDWDISNIMVKMDKVHPRRAVAVNGKVPMPVAKVKLGDTLVLNLQNNLDEPTGLHSHGILNNGTNYYDGAGMVTECGIAPGSKMAYRIPIKQTGTYWLHGHHNAQYINGLRGPLIVVDPDNQPFEYDDDIVLGFEDWFPKASDMKMEPGSIRWYEEPNSNVLNRTNHHNGSSSGSGKGRTGQSSSDPIKRQQKGHNMDQDSGMGMGNGMGMSMGGGSTSGNGNGANDPNSKYPIGVVNGVNGKDAPDLNFEPGKTYRLRLLNMGSTSMVRFGIEGHRMYVIEADGVETEPKEVPSVMLGVAQRVSVLVKARPRAERNFRYHFDVFSDVFPVLDGYNPRKYAGSVVYGNYLEYAPATKILWEELDDVNLVPLEEQPLLKPDVVHDVVISTERTSTELVQAFINGISFSLPKTPSLFTALNLTSTRMESSDFGRQCNAKILKHLDVVELRVINTDSVFHPMHLHGHFFQIVERGTIGDPSSARRTRARSPMRRDTVLVGPNKYVLIRFKADNPGVWLMHCHIERHMELGLSMMFVSSPEVMKDYVKVPNRVIDQCHKLGIRI
ncbi:ferroxidase fet3 [Coemansia sp. Benny D115]|nr:ferroxidase fet3 [Coemansia sp. Benny D115]